VGIDWTKVFFFWGDDRFVEPTNPYSNYGLVKNSLLSNAVGLPPENVFPIAFDASTPAQCAELYAKKIQEFFELRDGEWPVFDLAQNGIGPDGHTASLFPNTPAALEDDKIAVANHAGLKPWVDRISLTLPVFNHARNVVFVTSGAAKATTVKTVLEGSPSRSEMPAAHVKPIGGTLFWLLDRDASANLSMPLEKAY
jgi:6-phosphogluconolactonase